MIKIEVAFVSRSRESSHNSDRQAEITGGLHDDGKNTKPSKALAVPDIHMASLYDRRNAVKLRHAASRTTSAHKPPDVMREKVIP